MNNVVFGAFLSFFNVNTIFFTVFGYPMSYIEFFGTIFYLWSVWLISRRKILTWPIGIVSVLLYFAIFYQIALYSDALEQVYYLGASAYGWVYWKRTAEREGAQGQKKAANVSFSSKKPIILLIAATAIMSVFLGLLMKNLPKLLPAVLPAAASFPFLDALTTIMSFTAMFLMARKRVESWIYWIIVDVIGIGLYYVKNVKFISLLYIILLGLAINGLITWLKECRKNKKQEFSEVIISK
jgi:nicotinamide mononucleotide transporter